MCLAEHSCLSVLCSHKERHTTPAHQAEGCSCLLRWQLSRPLQPTCLIVLRGVVLGDIRWRTQVSEVEGTMRSVKKREDIRGGTGPPPLAALEPNLQPKVPQQTAQHAHRTCPVSLHLPLYSWLVGLGMSKVYGLLFSLVCQDAPVIVHLRQRLSPLSSKSLCFSLCDSQKDMRLFPRLCYFSVRFALLKSRGMKNIA